MVIENANVAEFLLDYSTQKMLHPFIGKEESVANAARILDLSISALLYRVQRLQEWGILTLVREEKRAGRPIKLYQTTTERFFIPFGVTRSETLEKFLVESKQQLETILTKNIAAVLQRTDLDFGMWIFKDEVGVICTQMATASDTILDFSQMQPAILDFYYPHLSLNQEDAKALQEELSGLIQKYAAKDGKQPYLVHIGLTPIKENFQI